MGLHDAAFVVASPEDADAWQQRATRGQVVTREQRNSFVATAGSLLDLLAGADRLLIPGTDAIRTPMVRYVGEVAEWSGRDVPLIGSVPAPADFLRKPAVQPSAGLRAPSRVRPAGAAVTASVLAEFLEEERDARRVWYGATAASLKALQASPARITRRTLVLGHEVSSSTETTPSGVLPVGAIVVAVVVVVAGVIGFVVREVVEVQEHAETARRAVEMQAASAQYAARLQEFARTGRMPPPGPAEVAVMARPASDASHPRNAADAFWQTMSDTAGKVAVASTVALFAATLGPPLLDRFGRWLDARAAR